MALQSTMNGDHLAPPLLDTLLKSATAGASSGHLHGGDLPAHDLQQQLGLLLAAAPAAAASIVGEPLGGLADAAGLSVHVSDQHQTHGQGLQHKSEGGSLGGASGVHVAGGAGDSHANDQAPQM